MNDDIRMVAFRAPSRLAEAINAAAARDFMSASDIVRLAVVKEMRDRGLLSEPHAASSSAAWILVGRTSPLSLNAGGTGTWTSFISFAPCACASKHHCSMSPPSVPGICVGRGRMMAATKHLRVPVFH
jgi:hypothetical protein